MFLSIVIPAFNAADYIKTSIESIGYQSNNDFEIIIVDDGSLDKTSIMAEGILKELEIDSYEIIRTVNKGVSSARNIGIEASKGEYILFLDADDYIGPSLVQCLYDVAHTDTLDLISWVFEKVDDGGNAITNYLEHLQAKPGKKSGLNMLNETLIEKNLWLVNGSIAYNRKFLMSNNIRYSEGCISGEDTEFILDSLALAKDSFFIKKTLYYYVEREGSITNSYNVRKFDAIQALKRIGEYFKRLNNPELDIITNYILSELIVESYLSHYEMCIRYLVNERGMSINHAVDKIEIDIDLYYQTLKFDVKKQIKNYKVRGIKANIKIQLFKVSPKICFSIIKMYRRLKSCKHFPCYNKMIRKKYGVIL